MLDRPVLITGAPCSGKSCVFEILRRADEFCGVNEPILVWDGGRRDRQDDRRTADEASQQERHRITRHCQAELRRTGRDRYVDNLSHHMLRLPLVRALFPDVRLIYIVRGPTDVIPEMLYGWTKPTELRQALRKARRSRIDFRSLPRAGWRFAVNFLQSRLGSRRRRTYGPVVPGFAEFAKHHSAAQIAAFQWLQLTQIAEEDIRCMTELRVLIVRYESLVDQPAPEARRIAEFAEVRDVDALAEFATGYLRRDFVPAQPQRVEPTPTQWAEIHAIIKDYTGSALDEASNPAVE